MPPPTPAPAPSPVTVPAEAVTPTGTIFATAPDAPFVGAFLTPTSSPQDSLVLSESGFSASLVGQTAHPFSQSIGFVVVESAAASHPDANPIDGSDMAVLLETNPTGAGEPTTLQVSAMTVTGNGLRVRFTQPFDTHELLGGRDGAESRIVVMHGAERIHGHVLVDPDGAGFAFIVDGSSLPVGDYTVRLLSGPAGFTKPDHEPLDGNYDGRPGGDFRGKFKVTVPGVLSQLERSDPGPAAADGFSAWAMLPIGAAALASMPGSTLPNNRRARDARTMLQRALAAGRRRTGAATAEEALIEIRETAAAAPEAAHASPGWVAGWLTRRTDDANDWKIRL